ncbi:hypothetical protein DF043_36335 [Burkholderia cepacia]|nr:hypothetical protein DF043_36335 [Burkholderia cepacia]
MSRLVSDTSMRSNFARQVENDASLNQRFLHSFLIGMLARASFRKPMIYSAVKRFFMFVFSKNELY